MTLETNNKEMLAQRSEILRLREQVQVLAGSGEPGAPAPEVRPNSVQERPIVRGSPMPQPPRAASAMD